MFIVIEILYFIFSYKYIFLSAKLIYKWLRFRYNKLFSNSALIGTSYFKSIWTIYSVN